MYHPIYSKAKNVCLVKQHIFVISMQEAVQRDYSLCTPLHGPPRSGDRIAYKVCNTRVINHFLILQNQESKQLLRLKSLDSTLGLEYLFEIGDCETK